ncbi:YibE/F family protein [Salidesulfovibrio brasiliensis]
MLTYFHHRRDLALVLFFAVLCAVLYLVPTGFEDRSKAESVRSRSRVVEVDNSEIRTFGLIRKGTQDVVMEILSGPYEGMVLEGHNQLLGQLDRDKLFKAGDEALAVITPGADGSPEVVNPQAHYRLGLELWLLGLFAALLIAFGGWTGAKALLSFLFTGLMLWKVMVPLMLEGANPILVALGVTALLSGAIIFLVAGVNRTGLTAFAGAFTGILTSCVLAVWFTDKFHVHGAVMPFAETLLYAGYEYLDLTAIFVSGVFLASSGAVMDLAMDVAASMREVVEKKPGIGRAEAVMSGIRVGRAVVGTMTTTLLLAYSGGYLTLLMAFMAQGIPLESTFNFVYVAAEVLKTLVGSFGLVLVAPFTALAGGVLLARQRREPKAESTAQSMQNPAPAHQSASASLTE